MSSARPAGDIVAILSSVGVLAAVCMAWVCWRASFPLEIDGNEAWNAWHADDAFAPSRLYPAIDALTNNNYPPLSFLVLRSISPLFANTILAGRFLSVVSILAAAGAVFKGARNLGSDRLEAAIGGVWFAATISLCFAGYAGMNDPNLFGLAISAWGFALFLSARGPARIYAAFALMAVAGFVKHNLVALPLSAFLYLALTRRDKAAPVLVFGLALCAIMLGAASAVYGPNLLAQMLAPRQLSAWEPWLSFRHLEWVAPIWPFWLFAQKYGEKGSARPLVGVLGGLGLLTWAFWRMGAGVDENVQFDLVFATALAVAMAFRGFRASRFERVLFGAVLIVRLLTSPETGPWLWLTNPSYRAEVSANAEIADHEIERVRELAGPVACWMPGYLLPSRKGVRFQ